jgi:ribonuclease HI
MKMTSEVILYTDGACSGNPGPGGWGFILYYVENGKRIERSGGEALTTNNRMEMLAVIEGLKLLKQPITIEIISDSKYVLQGMKEWMPKWKARGWTRKGAPLKNVELWQELDQLVSKHQIKYTHVKGHSEHPENERCDELATNAIKRFK